LVAFVLAREATFSTPITLAPQSAAPTAAMMPDTPSPTTTTSAFSVTDGEAFFATGIINASTLP
jgi:hypothetical protein